MDPQAPVTSFSEQTSKLRFYSLGIAAENKEKGSKELLVTPIEVLTLLDGEIGSDPSPSKAQGIDADGNSWNSTSTRVGNTVIQNGTDSDGNSFSNSYYDSDDDYDDN